MEELLNIDNEEWCIVDGALEACYIEEKRDVKIPDGTTQISMYAFNFLNLSSILVPKSVLKIERCAFEDCFGLKEIHIENENVMLENECLVGTEDLKSIYIGGQKIKVVVTQGEYGVADRYGECLERYLGDDEKYFVEIGINKIGETAFCNCDTLREVTLSQSVIEIETRAFAKCSSLSQIALTDSLEIIGAGAFSGCCRISEIKIPNSVHMIGESAFDGWNSNQTIYLPKSFKKLKFLQKWRKGCKAQIIYY